MKIIIVSDSHGNSGVLDRIFSEERGMDAVIHLGDGARDLMGHNEYIGRIPVCSIKGNNDFYCNDAAPRLITYFDNIKLYACHGHLLDVKYGLTKLYYTALQEECSLALFGHTHIPHKEAIDGVTLFNPGCAYKGYYGVLTTKGDSFEIVHKSIYSSNNV